MPENPVQDPPVRHTMTTQIRCPFCSSDRVYSLLNTLHCKRCKNMWHREAEDTDPVACGYCGSAGNPVLRLMKKTSPLEERLEERLDEYLNRNHGMFCMEVTAWKCGDISADLFRRYLRTCVQQNILAEKKDRCGRTWYSRTGKRPAADRSLRNSGNHGAGRTATR